MPIKKVDQLAVPDLIEKNSQTEDIQASDDARAKSNEKSSKDKSSRDHIDAINQMFAEFELAYHNQYHKAFPDEGALNLAKKYWLNSLTAFSPELVLAATRELVLTQSFLPTIANVVDACKTGMSLFGLPNTHDAYQEACRMPSPKAEQHWSHPAVYLAGQVTGWFELANQTEAQIFPLFDYHYSQLMQRVLHGEKLKISTPTPLPDTIESPLDAKENKSRLKELKANLKI